MGQANENPDFDEFISLRDAAELSGLSHSQLRLLVRTGTIWGRKIGRDWFTTQKVVVDYLAQERKPGPKPSSSIGDK
jgi:hypothetical protein